MKNLEYPPAVADPQQRARLLAALYIAQEQFGWLSPTAIERVANRLGLTPGQVKSTASFYTMFKLAPKGKYCIQVCEGLSCYLVGGSDPIIQFISEQLHIQPGETTPDGRFTLEIVQCLAACGSAPAIRINDELYENVSFSQIKELLKRFSGE